MKSTPSRLRIQGLCKSYSVPVLENVDLEVRAGEVHALVGANGAGKSTLARILGGLVSIDRGQIELDGKAYRPGNRADAEAAGVHVIHQELSLVATLSVAENLFLSRLPHRWGWIDSQTLHRDSCHALEAVGLGELDPRVQLSSLGIGEQQLIEIASVLSLDCRVLILDEPTAALSDPQVDILFGHIRRWKDRGVALIYISHRLEELDEIADRVSVLRDGHLVVCGSTAGLGRQEIVRAMTGSATSSEDRQTGQIGPVALRVRGLSTDRVRDIDFEVHAGEILGFAGLVGCGRTEVLRAIFGADRPLSGSVFRGDSNEALRIRGPQDARRAGIGLITEDRRRHGLLLDQSVRANFSLAAVERVSRAGWLDLGRESRLVQTSGTALGLQLHSFEQPVVELSGGNQQKVLIGRWLLTDCQVLLLDEPTRGIDVGARQAIHRLFADLAREGRALVVASSDPLELVELCDRVIVFRQGGIAASFSGDDLSYEAVSAACIADLSAPEGSLSG